MIYVSLTSSLFLQGGFGPTRPRPLELRSPSPSELLPWLPCSCFSGTHGTWHLRLPLFLRQSCLSGSRGSGLCFPCCPSKPSRGDGQTHPRAPACSTLLPSATQGCLYGFTSHPWTGWFLVWISASDSQCFLPLLLIYLDISGSLCWLLRFNSRRRIRTPCPIFLISQLTFF